MEKCKRFFYFLFSLLILAACTTKQSIRITDWDFRDVVQQYQNLTFVFNEPVVADSLVNQWDSAAYMSFQPLARGKYMWIATDQLVFSPVQPLAPSTDYTVAISPEILQVSEKNRIIDVNTISFHTPYLDLESVTSYWTRSEETWGKVEVRITFNFTSEIVPENLRQLLRLNYRNEPVPFTLISKNPTKAVEISVDGPNLESMAKQRIVAVISEGLTCVGSNWKSKQSVKKEVLIPAKEDLQVVGMTPVWNKGRGSILIRTTQPLEDNKLKEMVVIDPPVVFTVDAVRDGIQIEGEFMEGVSYKVSLSEKIRGVFGRELGKPFSQYITFNPIESYIAFTEKNARYLSSKGERNLGVQIIQVPRVKLSVFQIFENNLSHYLRTGKQWAWMYENDEYYDFYQYSFDEYYGQLVFSREIETSHLPRNGNIRLLNLDLGELGIQGTFKGVYLVKVESTDKKWLQDVEMVSLSDIGLIVKDGIEDIHVFANSLLDALPMTGVRIDFISRSNQVVYSATTDKQGHAVFRNKGSVLPDSPVIMITARKGDDFNFLNLSDTRVETSRFDVGGKRTQYSDYDVFIYGDRELYRPGDSVHINSIVRTIRWENVPGMPLKIRILTPDGRTYLSLKKVLNSQGAAESNLLIPTDAMTGAYTVEIYSGNDVLMGSSRFRVEEFMPDRIRVTASLDRENYIPADDIFLDIQAVNLFGPPAANRNYEVELQLTPRDFSSKSFPSYSFQVSLPNNLTFGSVRREGKTDANGHAAESFRVEGYENIGILEGKLFTTVFDETGRPVNRLSKFDFFTQELFYGIREMDYWMDTRKPVHLGFVAVNREGEKVSQSKAYLEIAHIRWETVIERSGNRYTYRSEKQESIMYSTNLTLNDGSATFDFTPSLSGMYQVRLSAFPGANCVSRDFYAYGYGDTDYTSFEVSREGEVLIGLDKEIYKPGDKAQVLFNAPFDGTLLVTMERGNVMDYQYVTTEDKAASLTFSISEDYIPNVYISATAIRRIGQDDLPITVAHGYASLNVEKKGNKLDLTVQAPESSRSKTKQAITVRTEPGAEVTVAVVDEGILQITDYGTPDPYAYFFQKRALEVSPYDLYAWLYPELKAQRSSFGGGEAFDLSRRISPLTSKRIRLVSLWSGILKADSRGECTFTADIPHFSGTLRVMAVAYKDNRFAGAGHFIQVADPIVISTALPRFLSPGDKISLPVMISNTTDRATEAKVSVNLKGPLAGIGSDNILVEVPAKGEKQVVFEARAHQLIGQGDVTIEVLAFGERFSENVQVPVRPAAGLQSVTGSGAVNGGGSQSFEIKTDFLGETTSSYLLLSKAPVVEFSKNLTQLVDYPYGCVEQVVSRAFPLLYYADLAKQVGQEKKNVAYNPDYLVREALRKIYSLQRYDGGLLFWPGGDEVSWWGTIYAAHFITEAGKAGYATDPDALKQMLRFINSRAKEKETEDYYFRDEAGNTIRYQWPQREIFYSLYILALNGSQNIALMNHYKPLTGQMTDDSRYLLAAAYLLTGDEASYRKLLPAGISSVHSQRSFGGSFYSHNRDLAIILSTLLDVDPENLQIPVFSKALSLELKQQSWLSTQEASFALMALGKLSNRAQRSTVQASVRINGSATRGFTGQDMTLSEDLNNKRVELNATGQGTLYYSYAVEGISASGRITEEDRYMQVRKAFFTRDGAPVSSRVFEQNELIVVKISVRSDLLSQIENVAITDILPACFEIENPRLNPERELTWIKDARHPDYLDIRDDRISFFTTTARDWKHFYYTVRAVSTGEYNMGPVSAEAMYNGEYHSYNGSGAVIVK